MVKPIELIVDRQIKRWELEKRRPQETSADIRPPGPIITISRQRGSLGSVVAERLAALTGFTLISRDILDQISFDMGAQKRLVETLDESVRSSFELWVEGMLKGRIIDSSDYLKSLVKIIGAISHHGNAIIVGRAANLILGRQRGFHVRVVADYDFRVRVVMQQRGISRKQAEQEIQETDEQRRKFVKSHFGRDIDDPRDYDLVMNSTFLSADDMAEIILNCYPRKRPATPETR